MLLLTCVGRQEPSSAKFQPTLVMQPLPFAVVDSLVRLGYTVVVWKDAQLAPEIITDNEGWMASRAFRPYPRPIVRPPCEVRSFF